MSPFVLQFFGNLIYEIVLFCIKFSTVILILIGILAIVLLRIAYKNKPGEKELKRDLKLFVLRDQYHDKTKNQTTAEIWKKDFKILENVDIYIKDFIIFNIAILKYEKQEMKAVGVFNNFYFDSEIF